MKSETKKALFFIFLIAAYSLQAIVRRFSFPYIYILGFIASVICVYVIKNKHLGFFIGIAVLLAMIFYDANYICLTVIAFLLICAHKNLMQNISSDNKKKQTTNDFSFVCVQFSLLAAIALIIYSFILTIDSGISITKISSGSPVIILFWLAGLFVYSPLQNKKDKQNKSSDKMNKQLFSSFRFMYLVSILGFAATVFFWCCVKDGDIEISNNAVFFPWFVYICSMIYNNDPYIRALSESVENLLNNISDKIR